MIHGLCLSNFKGFASAQFIPLRPLTLIFGANSSGKSSILQALLLLKQTLEEAEATEVALLPKGTLVDLGGYSELIHNHDISRSLGIRILCTRPPGPPARPARARRESFLDSANSFGAEFEFAYGGDPATVSVRKLSVFWGDHPSPATTWTASSMEPVQRGFSYFDYSEWPREMKLQPSGYIELGSVNHEHPLWGDTWGRLASDESFIERLATEQERLQVRITRMTESRERAKETKEPAPPRRTSRQDGRLALAELRAEHAELERLLALLRAFNTENMARFLQQLLKEVRLPLHTFLPTRIVFRRPFRGFHYMDMPVDAPDPARIALIAASEIRRALDSLVYMGPLREYPERHYIYSGNIPGHVGKSGKLVPDLLHKRPDLVGQVNDYLKHFGVPYDVHVAIPQGVGPELRDVFAIRLVHRPSGTSVSLLDAGFGISQVLPIIVQSLIAERRVICIEQPEIHLHPALQAELGDLLIDACLGKQKNQFVVETHSEHLILRIMRRMREGARNERAGKARVTPEDVGILYVQQEGSQSTVLHLRLDEDGSLLDPWPGGFFEEGFRERFV